jgi:hypothetical protein
MPTRHRTETKNAEADQAEGGGFGNRRGLRYELSGEPVEFHQRQAAKGEER